MENVEEMFDVVRISDNKEITLVQKKPWDFCIDFVEKMTYKHSDLSMQISKSELTS